MKAFILTIAILLTSFSTVAEKLEGTWEIKVVPDGKEQFPWWQQIKYPKTLEVYKQAGTFKIKFTDQFDHECSGSAMTANNGRELVFEYCGGLGTKYDIAWGSIHHAKIVNNQLNGTVTTNQYLFKWVGNRVE